MKHSFLFFGESINLDQNPEEVKSNMQAALDKYSLSMPNDSVVVEDYKETDSHSFELTIKRKKDYPYLGTFACNFIIDHDASLSLITGLDIIVLPYEPGSVLVTPLFPLTWRDDMLYKKDKCLTDLGKQQNKEMIKEDIKKIKVIRGNLNIQITVVYDDGTGKKRSKKSSKEVQE